MISPLMTRPQGCQKFQKIKLKTTLMSWSAKILPEFEKPSENRVSLTIFVQF